MPMKRKLIRVGDSRAVVIPAEWLRYHEDKTGVTIEDVYIEVNGAVTIRVVDKPEK